MHKLFRRIAVILAAVIMPSYLIAGYYSYILPDSYYTSSENEFSLPTALPISAYPSKNVARAASFFSNPLSQNTSLKLFGIVPIKNVEIQEIDTPMLIPCGQPFGIKLLMDGVMIVGFGTVDNSCPAAEAGLQKGDILHSINNMPITSNADLKTAVASSNGEPVSAILTRDGIEKNIPITPVFSKEDNSYEVGIWVRDSTAGVGTFTFYSPENNTFGGLGHPVCDTDTGICIPIASGEACPVEISSVKKGISGEPGVLNGTFLEGQPLGMLLCNNRCGVFGKLDESPSSNQAIPMGLKQEITTGEAEILCTVSGSEPSSYTIEIEDIDYSGNENSQNMIIRVTDEKLINDTGGIVQGMSGSPIIQNGKLIGAVTHVFVDDPTRGYGIFCENMYRFGLSGS